MKRKRKFKDKDKLKGMTPSTPFILIKMSTPEKVEIDVRWPKDCDINPFINMLKILNAGGLNESIVNQAIFYAGQIGESENGTAIRKILDVDRLSDELPVILPSKVISNLSKGFK